MSAKALIAGVGMVKFSKPGQSEPYEKMASQAIRAALADAGIEISEVQQAYAGFCMGLSCSGQRSLYEVGMPGIPVFNVNNACATGSSAIFLARQAVMAGAVDCALAFGFEEMKPGALVGEPGRTLTVDHIFKRFAELGYPIVEAMGAPYMFGSAGLDYLKRYDAHPQIFADVAVKTRSHAARNPYALFTKPLTVEEVMSSPVIFEPFLTRLMACPPTCGAAAALVVSDKFARQHGISHAIEIAGQGMTTDSAATYDSAMDLVGRDMVRRAAAMAYTQAAIGPQDVDVVELHDCFTPNEVLSYEALNLCGEGESTKFIADGDNTYGGKVVVNPSGGLMSKGHPLGATGLAQCAELIWHLRGEAGERQVANARVALQHNIGMGGACVVTVYRA